MSLPVTSDEVGLSQVIVWEWPVKIEASPPPMWIDQADWDLESRKEANEESTVVVVIEPCRPPTHRARLWVVKAQYW